MLLPILLVLIIGMLSPIASIKRISKILTSGFLFYVCVLFLLAHLCDINFLNTSICGDNSKQGLENIQFISLCLGSLVSLVHFFYKRKS